jgi:hypothetical protein
MFPHLIFLGELVLCRRLCDTVIVDVVHLCIGSSVEDQTTADAGMPVEQCHKLDQQTLI